MFTIVERLVRHKITQDVLHNEVNNGAFAFDCQAERPSGIAKHQEQAAVR